MGIKYGRVIGAKFDEKCRKTSEKSLQKLHLNSRWLFVIIKEQKLQGELPMKKLIFKLQNICLAAKVSVTVATITSIIMYIAATGISVFGGGIESKYLYESIADVATDIFAIGVFLGLIGDILVSSIGKNRKWKYIIMRIKYSLGGCFYDYRKN